MTADSADVAEQSTAVSAFDSYADALRDYFEVDARFVAFAALTALFRQGALDGSVLTRAMRELKIDPVALRRRNFITQFPYSTPVGLTYDTGGYEATLAKALKEASSGDLLELIATDPGSRSDIPSWAEISGNELLESSESDGEYRYLVRKV